MDGLLAGYRSPAFDEMVDADGLPYPHTKSLYEALQLLSADDLTERGAARARSFLEQGITFSSSGHEWVFPLDLIPRLIPEPEWEHIEAGVAQRVRALEAFLADVYGERQILADGIVPHQLVVTSGIRIAINVIANGYHLQFGDMNSATELFLGTNCIWRVCQGLLRVADLIAPVESN